MCGEKPATMTPVADATEIKAALDAVLASSEFQRAPSLSRLLQFIVEHSVRGDTAALKETVIGNELFGRPADYDNKLDSVVRVNANRLRQQLEKFYASGAWDGVRIELPRGSYTPIFIAPPTTAAHGAGAGEASTPGPATASFSLQATHPHQRPTERPWPLLTVVAALSVSLLWASWALVQSAKRAHSTREWIVHPFSNSGLSEEFADFSPDGEKVAFVSKKGDDAAEAVYVRDVASDNARRVTMGTLEESRPAWSPDGKQLALLRLEGGGRKQVIVRTMATGAEKMLAEIEGGPLWLCRVPRVSWSRDGARLFTSAAQQPAEPCGIISIDLASGLVTRVSQPPHGTEGDLEAAVSPDGRSLAFLRNYAFLHSDIFIGKLDGSAARKLTHEQADVIGFAWSRDGRSLVVASNRLDGRGRLWEIPVNGGEPGALTDGGSLPAMPAVDPKHDRILFSQAALVSSIWQHRRDGASEVISDGRSNMDPSISPDGQQLLYSSDRSGMINTWISDSRGTRARPLLQQAGITARLARWSPDGQSIVFECSQGPADNLCVTDSSGGHLRQLTHTSGARSDPTWSYDSKSIFYAAKITGRSEAYRQDLNGSPPVQLTHTGASRVAESADGRWLFVSGGPAGGIEVFAAPTGQTGVKDEEGRVLVPEVKGDWEVSGDRVLVIVRDAMGTPMLTEYAPGAGARRALYPVPGYAEGTIPNFSVDTRNNVIYLAHGSYREDLNLLETSSSR